MPEVSEKLRDISAATTTHVRRLGLHQTAYLKTREEMTSKLAMIFPYLHPDYLKELREITAKEIAMLHELGEIMTLIGTDVGNFVREIRESIDNV